MSRRQKDPDRESPSRIAIIGAAAELFGSKGYHATSVRDISDEVGLLAGSLYSHIESKQQVLAEILRGFSARAVPVLESLEEADMSTRDKLAGVFAVYLHLISEFPSQARVAVHDSRSLARAELEEARRRRRRTQAIVARILQGGIDRGELSRVDTKLVTMAVFSITNWAVEWYDPAGPLDPDQAGAFFADLLVEGIRARRRAGGAGG